MNNEQLKACRVCYADNAAAVSGQSWAVKCMCCFTKVQGYNSRAEAIVVWNNLMQSRPAVQADGELAERIARMIGGAFFDEHAKGWEEDYAIAQQKHYRELARQIIAALSPKADAPQGVCKICAAVQDDFLNHIVPCKFDEVKRLRQALDTAIKTLTELRPVNQYVWVGDDQFNVGDFAEFALKDIEQALLTRADEV